MNVKDAGEELGSSPEMVQIDYFDATFMVLGRADSAFGSRNVRMPSAIRAST